MTVFGKIVAGILLLAGSNALASTQVQQPERAFGYVIGDMLEQRIRLQVDAGPVELAGFPPLQRVGPWLQRRSSYRIRDSLQQSWLVLQYQVINSPPDSIVTSLPALDLKLVQGARLAVDAWPISISPLTPSAAKYRELLPPMRPDRGPLAPDTRVAGSRLRVSAIMLAITLLSWMGWWFWRRHADVRRLPFARAFHEIRKFDSRQLEENADAWLLLHRAFDGAAGRSIHRSAVGELLRSNPWLESLQARIEAFYSASAARFFEQSEQLPPFALVELCRLLYLAEKRHTGAHSRVRG